MHTSLHHAVQAAMTSLRPVAHNWPRSVVVWNGFSR